MRYKITYIKDGKIRSDSITASSKENIDFPYEILSIKEISDFSLPRIGKNNCDSLFKELSIIVNSSLTLAQTIHLLMSNTKNSYHKEILNRTFPPQTSTKPLSHRTSFKKNESNSVCGLDFCFNYNLFGKFTPIILNRFFRF